MARHKNRLNSNKIDASHGNNSQRITKRQLRDNNVHLGERKKKYEHVPSSGDSIVESSLKFIIFARTFSAVFLHITDCDETFNYWEPLHYLIYGHGLQTWEYSSEFALRSYTYLLMHGVPAWIYKQIIEPNPMFVFYFLRWLLAIVCSIVEWYLYKAISREFGINIGKLWLFFQMFSAGMFISAASFLPSSFSMYFSSAAFAAWWHQNYRLAVLFVAISALLGWPFAVLLGIPIAYDMVWRQKLQKTFIIWVLISGATIVIPMTVIDSTYYGKLTIAPLNLILYNVFTSHGPNLYGVEPISYYLINGFLNFNFVWIFALITPAMIIMQHYFIPAKSKSTLNFPHYISLAGFYLWLSVFFMQPHKEERFLFPVYPLITLCGAITVDIIQKLMFRMKERYSNKRMLNGTHYLDHTKFVGLAILFLTSAIGLSRILALYHNYHAPMELFKEFSSLPETNNPHFSTENICIGKDWYRFPSSFFLPNKYRLRFIKSEFKGMLPAYYYDGENATALSPSYFNDMNQENEYMYFDYNKCNYLIHFDDVYTKLEPNYSSRIEEWEVLKSYQYMISNESSKLFRSFYIPGFQNFFVKFGNFNLLRNKITPIIDNI